MLVILEADEPRYLLGAGIATSWQPRPRRQPINDLNEFVDFRQPGWVKLITDFELHERAGRTQIITTTRVLCTDNDARRRFRLYWAAIRPAGALIRRDLLATLGRLATRPQPLIPSRVVTECS